MNTTMRPWYRATITEAGTPGRNYGEPRATIFNVPRSFTRPYRNIADRRDVPLGWNIGQSIPAGTEGYARYETHGDRGLWRFVAEIPAEAMAA